MMVRGRPMETLSCCHRMIVLMTMAIAIKNAPHPGAHVPPASPHRGREVLYLRPFQ